MQPGQYQILTPGRFAAAENLAASHLQDALHRMTGVRLPVRSVEQRVDGIPAIVVGERETKAPGLWEKDRYEITPSGGDLLLRGNSRRACHYAVNAWLEMLGARFYGPGSEVWPTLSRVALPRKPVSSAADFSYRHVFYPTAQTPLWASRWKLNVHDSGDRAWGENARAHSWGHSFEQLVPLKEHFAKHPEYFSLVDGRRRDVKTQLCCTNPEVADVACETMARWIAANPDRRIFAVGMNDWDGWCECDACAKADRREGGQIGQLLTLVNRVAERFPDRIIATLAYAWAIDPPKRMRARDNVAIVLCHNHGCYTHALDGCDHNALFLERLRGWKRKSRRILIWDYYVNYHSYLMPTPNFRRIARDFRTYRDMGIEAMFCQGSAVSGGQFEGLRQYLQAKLLWNAEQDAWGIVEEWVTGVYGRRSGGHILEYLSMLEDHVEKNEIHMPSFGGGQEVQPKLFTPKILARGKMLWDRAERDADDATREKVFAARAPEMCARLFHTGMTYSVSGGKLRPTPAPDRALAARFAHAAMQGGAAHLREDAGAPESFARNYGRTYRAIVLESDALHVVIVPELGGRIYSLVHRATGQELMHRAELAKKVNYLPYGAGYEFALQPAWQAEGTREAYACIEQSPTHAVIAADLPSGLHIDTRFTLAGDTLTIAHEVTNPTSAPATIEPFTHPEWNYHAFGDAATLHLGAGRGARGLPLNPEPRPNRDLEFAGKHLPRGTWQVRSAVQPIMLHESFDAAALARARMTFGGWGNLNLELYFRRITLRPRQSRTFTVAWRITS